MLYSESENLKHDEELNIIFKKQEQNLKPTFGYVYMQIM